MLIESGEPLVLAIDFHHNGMVLTIYWTEFRTKTHVNLVSSGLGVAIFDVNANHNNVSTFTVVKVVGRGRRATVGSLRTRVNIMISALSRLSPVVDVETSFTTTLYPSGVYMYYKVQGFSGCEKKRCFLTKILDST